MRTVMCCTVPAWVINAFYLIIFVLLPPPGRLCESRRLSIVDCVQNNSNSFVMIVITFAENGDKGPGNS